MPPSAMASTRRAPPLDIYQDPDASFGANSGQDVETALLNALRPLSDASSKHNIQLKPNPSSRPGSSPRKTDSSPARPISAHGLSNLEIPPPRQPDFGTDSPQKKASFYRMYPSSARLPEKGLFSQFSSTAAPRDKKNIYDSTAFPGTPLVQSSEPEYGYKGPMKRGLMDAAPSRDRSAKKLKTEKEETFELPDSRDMPTINDDGSKPPHSYAELIGMAILRAHHRRLTLAQIYKWISDNFAFYRLAESGWQNSIRHNLSLNKNFIKQERPKDDPGKGNYWAIKPGEERPYLLGKKNPPARRVNPDGSSYIQGLPSDIGSFRSSSIPAIGQFSLAPNPVKKPETKFIDSAKFPDEAGFSSDGTIPASDPALQEDDNENNNDNDNDNDKDENAAMVPPPSHFRSSPPPQDIGSSPPQMLAPPPQRKGTPPPVPHFPSTSRSGGRRPKFAGMHDSGYWSSIESSAARGAAYQLTSEADTARPRIKKGRAEAEIARMRSSSFDSPSKDKVQHKAPTSHFDSSSPLKDNHPLTPAIVFKRPARPPPSISPNTNLRNHRDRMRALLGSPAKTSYSPMPETSSWSPAFNLSEDGSAGLTPYISPYKPTKTPWKPFSDNTDNSVTKNYDVAFDIFIDAPEETLLARGSPEKRPAKRPSLTRAATSTGVLADITGTSKSNNTTSAPPSDSPFSLSPFMSKLNNSFRSPARLGSPLKQNFVPLQSIRESSTDMKWLDIGLGGENLLPQHGHDLSLQEPRHVSQHNHNTTFGALDLPSDGSEEAIDIFQDFGKIGQQAQHYSNSTHMIMPQPDRSTGSPVKRFNMGPPARPTHPSPALERRSTSRW